MSLVYNILLVDDNETEQFFNKIIFEKHFGDNVSLYSAYDGLEAIEKLSHGDVKFDCIVLDVSMPRMNGFEFLEEYSKGALGDAFIVMLSSTLHQEEKDKAISYDQVLEFFSKPMDAEKLGILTAHLEAQKSA